MVVRDVFEVVADPTRRRILDLLREGERPVGELVAALGVAQPNVSKHLRVLDQAALVRVRVEGPRRHLRAAARPAPRARGVAGAVPRDLGGPARRPRAAPGCHARRRHRTRRDQT
ncbi:metalloregulator ArsR/SmtB family transcription factor [Nocardioides sp. TF02-7]|uniref:ArsR/SmtB family transcription factor n=1 Tax=Nocardioides sp. TF02-7 TaxID=2917724 RepID=UPI0031F54538